MTREIHSTDSTASSSYSLHFACHSNDPFDLVASHKNLYFGVVAGTPNLGSANTAVDLFKNVVKTKYPETRFSETTHVVIDGRTWQAFTGSSTVQGMPFEYQYYIYTGPEGTFHLVGWTFENLFEHDASELRAVM